MIQNDLLVAMAYDGDGNRIFQLNYNLHTDDDWKGNSGNGNGNNKDNSGSGNKGNNSGNGTGSKKGILTSIGSFFGMDDWDRGVRGDQSEEPTVSNATRQGSPTGIRTRDKGNNGNDKNNGKGNGNGNSGNNGEELETMDNGNSGNHGNGNGNTSTGGNNDNNGNANGNTNNTGGSQNQSGILFPVDGRGIRAGSRS